MKAADSVVVKGLDDFRRELRRLDDAALTDQLKDANQEVAQLVVDKAKSNARALGGMEAKAAASLAARRGQARSEVSLGGRGAEFAAGAEFGAHRNKIRLLKQSGSRRKQRAYIVRSETAGAVAKATKRIEAQSNINTGQKVAGTGQVRGWDQFVPWTGNKAGAGRFLFPAIRQRADDIVEVYGDAIDKLTKQAFPD